MCGRLVPVSFRTERNPQSALSGTQKQSRTSPANAETSEMACRSTTGRVRPPGDVADGRGHAVEDAHAEPGEDLVKFEVDGLKPRMD